MSKGKIRTLVAVCALVLTSAVTPAAARWWRGGYFYRAYGSYGYGFVGNSFRPPAGQIWVRGFRNAPTPINMKTAKALGLTVPVALLSRADKVIE